jgi:ATP-binding cassette subfamily B (MDR/TAP) protein 1
MISLTRSLGHASPSMNAFASGQAAAYKMFDTIKRKPKIDAYDPSGVVLEDIKGEIELKDVYFRYPARPEVQIFSGFSLHVPSGTTTALVGQSGSGKSTVISLVERFYDPEAGEILIDGVNLKQLQLKWIREKIGLVSQEPILFATTIKENIAYGKENATEDEIRTAIVLANAAKFIDKLPKVIVVLYFWCYCKLKFKNTIQVFPFVLYVYFNIVFLHRGVIGDGCMLFAGA